MPSEKLFKIIIFILLVIGGLVFNLNRTFSYSPNPTHYNLAREMVELYNLTYEPDINPRQLELILKGSMDEDAAPRWSFHLYDPIYNRAPFGVATAKIWALDPDFRGDFIHTLANFFLSIFTKNEEDFRVHDDYSWPSIIKYYNKGKTEKAYYGLGHILHLIADMSVPAHSRNDHHITGDPFESWTANIDFSSDYNINLAENLYKKYRLEEIYSIEQVFDELAKYSNRYFFSKDSIIGTELYKDYNWPKIIKEEKEDYGRVSQRTYGWGADEYNKIFRLVRIQSDLLSGERLYFLREDDTNLQTDYWIHLAPKAVYYGAGAIKLFMEEIGKEVALSGSLAQIKPGLPLIASIVSPFAGEPEVKGESIEKQDIQPEEKKEIQEPTNFDEKNKEGGITIVSGPTLSGDNWSAPTQNQFTESGLLPPSTPEPPQEPSDTTPPDVSLDSLTYNYKLSFLTVNWSSSEFPSVSFDVEYREEGRDWQPLLTDTFETRASLSVFKDIVYYFRVKAVDLAGNESEWQEKSIKINPGPSPITDLSIDYENNIFLTLKWTAPYSDNPLASLSYYIRYSENPISEENWNLAKPISDFEFSQKIPQVEAAETIQTIDITPLKFNSTYYFAIKTFDGTYFSDISNIVRYSTGSQPTLMKSAWPTFQRDQQRTGFVPYAGPEFLSSQSVTTRLIAELPNPPYTSLVKDNNEILYFGGEKGLYAVDLRNGEVKWFYDTYNYELNRGGVYYAPTLASDGTIYFCSFGGTYLYALTPNGKLKWRFLIAGPNDGGSAPVIGSDGTVYVSSREQGYVYAINPDGTKKWDLLIIGAAAISPPVIDPDETIYVAWRNMGFVGYITAISSDGAERWQSENINPNPYAGLSIDTDNNAVYVGSNYYDTGYLNSVKSSDGSLNWSFLIYGKINVSASIANNGKIYIGGESGGIFLLNPDGTSSTPIYTEKGIYQPMIVDIDGIVYFISGNKINVYYPDGSEKWSYEFSEDIATSPIMDENGMIYICTRDGKLWKVGE